MVNELNPALARVIFHFREFVLKENAWSRKKRHGETHYPTCEKWPFNGIVDIVLHLPVFTNEDVGLFILFLEKRLCQDATRITDPGEVTTFDGLAKLFPLQIAA